MIKKILALLLIVSVCMSFSACKVKRSGKPYLNYSDGGADGFVYHTEEKQTDNFIAFTDRSGNLRLYLVSGEKYGVYYTECLCKVDPGEIYKITYDVQTVSGGIGGDYNGYLLAVYDCEPVAIDALFENGYAEGFFGNIYEFQYEGYYEAPDFVAFISDRCHIYPSRMGHLLAVNGAEKTLKCHIYINQRCYFVNISILENSYRTDYQQDTKTSILGIIHVQIQLRSKSCPLFKPVL